MRKITLIWGYFNYFMYKPLFEKTVKQLHIDIKDLYDKYHLKFKKFQDLINFISKKLNISNNTVLEILQYVEHKEKHWVTIKLEEDLRLSDFKKHAGISGFTEPFMKDRQKRKGAGNKSAHLVKMKVNRKKDYVTFVFYSAPTYDLTGKITGKNGKMSKESPWYTQEIRILDFFKWAKTTPGYKSAKQLSVNDLKDIFKVASVQVNCNDPSFWWQGDAWVLSQFDAAINPTDIAPKHWEKLHNNDNFLCKHLDLIFAQIEFFIPIMASMLSKYLKENM